MTNTQRLYVAFWCVFWVAVLVLAVWSTIKYHDGLPLECGVPLSTGMLLLCKDYVGWLKEK